MQSFKIVDEFEKSRDSARFKADDDQMIRLTTKTFSFLQNQNVALTNEYVHQLNKLVLFKMLIIKRWAKNTCLI